MLLDLAWAPSGTCLHRYHARDGLNYIAVFLGTPAWLFQGAARCLEPQEIDNTRRGEKTHEIESQTSWDCVYLNFASTKRRLACFILIFSSAVMLRTASIASLESFSAARRSTSIFTFTANEQTHG